MPGAAATRNELCPCGSGLKRKRCRAACEAPLGLPSQVRRKIILAWPSLTEAQRAKLAACDPILWAMYASRGTWFPAPHLEYLADELLEWVRGEVLRLAISVPPQHGKSEFISKYFPAWLLGRFPAARLLQCSYGQELTVEWTAAARDLFAEHGPAVFGVDTWTRSKRTAWNVYRNGRRTGGGIRGVGKGGGVTGRPVDFGILDDIIKDRAEADSKALRDAAWKWLESAVFPRAKRLLFISTRWHHDDPIGRLQAKQKAGRGGARWRFVNLPALAEEDDPLGRKPGEPLWIDNPQGANGDASWYREKELEVGPYVWAALYQGRPTPLEGSLFKRHWFAYFSEEGAYFVGHESRVASAALLRFVTFDPAFSKKTSADHSAIGGWALDVQNRRLYLLEVVRKRFTPKELAGALRSMMSKIGAELCFGERNNLKENAMKIVREAVPLREIQPNTDKVSRAMPVTAHLADGRLLFRRDAPWLADLETELLVFGPHADQDDQVDMVSYGVYVANEELGGFRGLPDVGPPPSKPGPPGGLVPMLRRPT